MAASLFKLWLTPSLSISILVESERTQAPLVRLASQLATLSRFVLGRPSLLREALEDEVLRSPLVDLDTISSTTLRRVDHAYFLAREGSLSEAPLFPEEILMTIGYAEGVEEVDITYRLLEESLRRVLISYEITSAAVRRAATPFATDGSDDAALKQLFSLLRPSDTLSGLVSKQWQDIGFQGSSPTTDFRGLGMLGLESLLFFANEYGDRAVTVVDESVHAGDYWYPLAVASIHMTSAALEMGTSRDLQLVLLRSLQTRPAKVDPELRGESTNLEPFLRIASELLLLFHTHWKRGKYTVMQFEAVSKEFQAAVRPWLRRGVLDGRALGWDMDETKED